MRPRNLCLIIALACAPAGAFGQDSQTLADIRQDLTVLSVEMKRLQRELSTTGGASVSTGSGDLLDRVNAIEGELQRLTGQTEELEFRINQVVRDGTNRVGDLEFRLCELEPGCDIGTLGETSTLGGGDVTAVIKPTQTTPQTELAVGEEADFRRAKAALAESDFRSAAQQFETFGQTYPGSPLEEEALVLQGQAHMGDGNIKAAARAFLDSFSRYPDGPFAPKALFSLGVALNKLNDNDASCQILEQVEIRYPDAPEVQQANSALRNQGCS